MHTKTWKTSLLVIALSCTAGPVLAQPEPPPAEETPAPEEVPPEPASAPEPPPSPAPASETPAPAPAAEAGSLAPKISGHVNATYNYNFIDPMGGINEFHSYDKKHNTFLLNAAHIALTGSNESVSYAVELDFGGDAGFNLSANPEYGVDVQEAYVAYTSTMGLGFKAGKFVTYNGIEVVESPANPTISRGFLYGLAEPVAHVGGVLTYKVNDMIDVALGAVNGFDLFFDNNDMKTIVGKVGVTTEAFLLTLSAYAGPEQMDNEDDWRASFDATGVYKMGTMDLWFQGNVGMEQGLANGDAALWVGGGVQPFIHLSKKLDLGVRAEVFADLDGAKTEAEQTLVNLSVAPAFKVADGVVTRLEARFDYATEDSFVNTDGDAKAFQVQALAEAIVSF